MNVERPVGDDLDIDAGILEMKPRARVPAIGGFKHLRRGVVERRAGCRSAAGGTTPDADIDVIFAGQIGFRRIP